MNQIFKEDEKEKQPKPKIVTIRVADKDLQKFLDWLMTYKGPLSEFTRRVWKKTAEYEEYSRIKNKRRSQREVPK